MKPNVPVFNCVTQPSEKKSQYLKIIASEKAHHLILTFFVSPLPFLCISLSLKEHFESTRHQPAALLKEYTIKLNVINTTKLQALYKMSISVLERLAIDCCWSTLIWMLLHFVSVSGFIEAGRKAVFLPDKLRDKILRQWFFSPNNKEAFTKESFFVKNIQCNAQMFALNGCQKNLQCCVCYLSPALLM